MAERMFAVTPKSRRRGTTRALVALNNDRCLGCGAEVIFEAAEQDALLRAGGHGATRRTVVVHCQARCGWSRVAEISECRPPRSA